MGNIGGVKLAIPPNYLFGPMTYEGVDIWNPKSFAQRPKNPTFDNAIDNFAIRLRLSNLRPIESRQDWRDYNEVDKYFGDNPPPASNRWIVVGIDSDFAAYNSDRCNGNHSCYLKNILKDESHWGPFVLQQTDLYGLKHYLSPQKSTPGKAAAQFDEVFYDAATDKTIITCSTLPLIPPPHTLLSYCKHTFFVPELQARIEIRYDHPAKDNLARWPEVERAMRGALRSFVVP